jgi:hypothetical protein
MPGYSVANSIVGGTFVAPGARQQIVPEREVIYRGTTMGHVRSMDVDPEGRFLLLLSYSTGTVYRFDLLTTPPQLNTAFEPTAIPHLTNVRSLWIGDFAQQGRKCTLSEIQHGKLPEVHHFTILDDANNDGVFENHTTYGVSEWQASPYSNYASNNWKHPWDNSPPLNTSGQ